MRGPSNGPWGAVGGRRAGDRPAVGARHCSPRLLGGCSDVLHASSTTQSMPANRLGEYSSGVLPAMQVSVSIVLRGGRRKVG